MLSEIYSLPKPQTRQIEYAVRQLGGALPGLAKAPIGFAMVAYSLLLGWFGPVVGRSREDSFGFFALLLLPFLAIALSCIGAAKFKVWYSQRFGYVTRSPRIPWTPREMKFAAFAVVSGLLLFLLCLATVQPHLPFHLSGLVIGVAVAWVTLKTGGRLPIGPSSPSSSSSTASSARRTTERYRSLRSISGASG